MLFQSLLDNPSAYADGTAELLQDLINKRRTLEELTEEELDLLDNATLDFASERRPKPKKLDLPKTDESIPAAARAAMGELDNDEPDLEWRDHGAPVAVSSTAIPDLPPSPPTFWWRNK